MLKDKLYSIGSYAQSSSLEGNGQERSVNFQKVTNQLIDAVLRNGLAIENDGAEITSKQAQTEIQIQIREIVNLLTQDIDPGSDAGQRIKQFARPILETFIHGNYIRAVHKDSYLNLVVLALLTAKDPSLFDHLTINTGFGGSADHDVNLRLPAYIVPGLKMLEGFRELKDSKGLDFNLPQFRVFFAPYAAIAVNGAEMVSEDVLSNLQKSQTYLSEYVNTFHPGIADNVVFDVENPWEDHNENTRMVLDVFSSVVSSSTNEEIQRVLQILQERGANRGKQTGKDLSHVYAAIHPLLFKDSLNHPPVNIFQDEGKSLLTLSIGGRPERLFNTIRAYIRKNINSSTVSDISHLDGYAESASFLAWRDTLNINFSNGHTEMDFFALPLISTMALTTIGSFPVYYATEHDQKISMIEDMPSEFLRLKANELENLDSKQRSIAADRLKQIKRDMTSLIEDAGGEETLIKFIEALQEKL